MNDSCILKAHDRQTIRQMNHLSRFFQSVKYGLHLHVQSLPNLAPVCVGVIGGYLIEHHRNVKLPRKFFLAGWIIAGIVTNCNVFGEFERLET